VSQAEDRRGKKRVVGDGHAGEPDRPAGVADAEPDPEPCRDALVVQAAGEGVFDRLRLDLG
jgi:hypothetical protein